MARDAADPAASREGRSGRGAQIWIAGIAGLMTLMLALQIWAGFGVISSTRAVADGDALLRETDNLLHLLQEAEIAQGRYLRLRSATALEDYRHVRGSAPAAFSQLARLAEAERPDGGAGCSVMLAVLDEAFRSMDRVIDVRQAAADDEVLAAADMRQAQAVELARRQIALADVQIGQRISARLSAADENFTIAAGASLLGFSFAIPSAIAMFRRLRRSREQERHLRLQVEAANLQLESRVAVRTAELLRANRALADANAVKDRFLANMSHELRTPLNAVIGFSDMIATEMLGPIGNPRYTGYARDILASGRHLLALIEDILDLSRIQAGRIDIDPVDISPRQIATEAISIVSTMAAEDGVEIVLDADQAPDQARLDARRVKQVLINLLTNAIRYGSQGGEIRMTIAPADTAPHVVRFVVEDGGAGMTEAELARALQPFEQVSADRQRRAGGTGLGLPLTRLLVLAHRGRFDITSSPGVGTRVVIEI
jgi:signal transduction histidine kinase